MKKADVRFRMFVGVFFLSILISIATLIFSVVTIKSMQNRIDELDYKLGQFISLQHEFNNQVIEDYEFK